MCQALSLNQTKAGRAEKFNEKSLWNVMLAIAGKMLDSVGTAPSVDTFLAIACKADYLFAGDNVMIVRQFFGIKFIQQVHAFFGRLLHQKNRAALIIAIS